MSVHHGRIVGSTKLSKIKEHRVRIELTLPLYESGVIPLDHQCLSIQWDRWASNPHRSPQTTCASHYTSRPIVVSLSVDLLGVEPRSLDCKSKRRPVGKPLGISVTRVGFEPDLAGLKDQRPHQKSNEPHWLCRCAPVAQLFSRCSCRQRIQWTERCSNSPLRFFRPPLYRLSYQSMYGETLEEGTKKPGVTCG